MQPVQWSILELLEQHGSLGYEQITSFIGVPADAVRAELQRLRERGLVDAVTVGVLEGQLTNAASYWRLTDEGRAALEQRRSG